MKNNAEASKGDVMLWGAYNDETQDYDWWAKADDPDIKDTLDSWRVLGYTVQQMTIRDMTLAIWKPDMRKRFQ